MNLKKLERYLPVNLLVPGPRLIKKKKNLPGRGLTKVEKYSSTRLEHRVFITRKTICTCSLYGIFSYVYASNLAGGRLCSTAYISVSQIFFKWGPLSLVRMFYGPPHSWDYQTH